MATHLLPSKRPNASAVVVSTAAIRLEGTEPVLVDRNTTAISGVDVIDHVLDKGIVIDGWARVSLAGMIDLLTIETRIVVASIDTYLKYAESFGHAFLVAGSLPPVAAFVPERDDRDSPPTPLPLTSGSVSHPG